jgi:hypothetical protein
LTRFRVSNFFSGAYEREGAEKYERGVSQNTEKLSLRRSAFMIFKGGKLNIVYLIFSNICLRTGKKRRRERMSKKCHPKSRKEMRECLQDRRRFAFLPFLLLLSFQRTCRHALQSFTPS